MHEASPCGKLEAESRTVAAGGQGLAQRGVGAAHQRARSLLSSMSKLGRSAARPCAPRTLSMSSALLLACKCSRPGGAACSCFFHKRHHSLSSPTPWGWVSVATGH